MDDCDDTANLATWRQSLKLKAAALDNTRKAYQVAVRHFEVEWGGLVPANAESVARYLVDHAESSGRHGFATWASTNLRPPVCLFARHRITEMLALDSPK